jgi:toxin ParE1/3/4
MGRRGRVLETRELVIPRTPFIVPYAIHVLRIFRAARQWPEAFETSCATNAHAPVGQSR